MHKVYYARQITCKEDWQGRIQNRAGHSGVKFDARCERKEEQITDYTLANTFCADFFLARVADYLPINGGTHSFRNSWYSDSVYAMAYIDATDWGTKSYTSYVCSMSPNRFR